MHLRLAWQDVRSRSQRRPRCNRKIQPRRLVGVTIAQRLPVQLRVRRAASDASIGTESGEAFAGLDVARRLASVTHCKK